MASECHQARNNAPLERAHPLPSNHVLAEREVVYWTDLRDPTVLLSQYDSGLELETFLNAKLRKHCEFIAHNQLLLV